MTFRFVLAAALATLTPLPAIAQTETPPPAEAPHALVHVTLTTTAGPIVIALEKDRAPISTANFLHYVDTGRFDGIAFYRAMNVAPGTGLIQAGIRDDVRKLYPPIAHEPTSQTGLSNTDGAISMARYEPGSATADFFLIVGNMAGLDAQPSQPGVDTAGFAAFRSEEHTSELQSH